MKYKTKGSIVIIITFYGLLEKSVDSFALFEEIPKILGMAALMIYILIILFISQVKPLICSIEK